MLYHRTKPHFGFPDPFLGPISLKQVSARRHQRLEEPDQLVGVAAGPVGEADDPDDLTCAHHR